jgi:hypothetical protein
MKSNEYHFITHWRVEGSVKEVADLLGDALALPRWWPTVYLEVRELEPEQEGRPAVIELHTKGWLPYTLKWQLRKTESRYPYGFTIEASGDFDGRGVWTFQPDGSFVNITYDWKIRADKPLLRYLSFLFKPIFSANHRWAMAQGEASLRAELTRRRAAAYSRP